MFLYNTVHVKEEYLQVLRYVHRLYKAEVRVPALLLKYCNAGQVSTEISPFLIILSHLNKPLQRYLLLSTYGLKNRKLKVIC